MRILPLNLISTPLAVLSSLGLTLRVGLSSEDPMVGRNATEAYEAYLSVYSPEGLLLERIHLGQIPPSRRRFFDVSAIAGQLVHGVDHLAVVHRIPSRLMAQVSNLEDEIELETEADYSLFRSLVEYSYPQGGNGSVIYETPPRLNAGGSGQKSSNTLTFTCQTLLSDVADTHVVLINYSVDPTYSRVASFSFVLHSQNGDEVASDSVAIGPFAIKTLDIARLVPKHLIEKEKDPRDGSSAFTFVGYSDDAAILVVILNTAPALGGVAIEHTHPPQAYLFPSDPRDQQNVKVEAENVWKTILSAGRSVQR